MVVRWAWIDAQLSKNEAAKPPPWRANGNGVEVGRFPHDGVHTRTFYAQISGVSEGRTPTVSKGGSLEWRRRQESAWTLPGASSGGYVLPHPAVASLVVTVTPGKTRRQSVRIRMTRMFNHCTSHEKRLVSGLLTDPN